MKEQVLGAQQHQDIPFEQVVEMVQPARVWRTAPVFQVMLRGRTHRRNFAGASGWNATLKGSMAYESAKFDLTSVAAEEGGRIEGGVGICDGAVRAGDDRAVRGVLPQTAGSDGG